MSSFFVAIVDSNGYRDTVLENREFVYRTVFFYCRNFWYMALREDTSFLDGTKLKRMEYGYYEAYLSDGERISIFVYENSSGKDRYSLCSKTDELFFQDGITLLNPYVNRNSFSLCGNIFRTNCDLVLVNNLPIKKECVLKDGDRINIAGTVIVWFSTFVYLNGFLCDNRLQVYEPHFNPFHYSCPSLRNLRNSISLKMPVLNVRQPDMFSFAYRKENISIRQFVPSLIMSLTMVMTALVNVMNMPEYENGRMISYLIMPMGMVMAMVLWPLIWALHERNRELRLKKKAISEYLDCLDDFNIKLKEDIDIYLEKIREHIFKDTDSLFYISHNHESFGTLCLGNTSVNNAQSLCFSKEKRIMEALETTRELYERRIPFIINLFSYRKVNIITRKEDIKDVMEGIITELSGKHNPEDLKIAVYVKDESLLKNIRFLPHLFLHRKRLVYEDKELLKELENSSYKRKTVLICLCTDVIEIKNENVMVISLLKEDDKRNTADLNIEIIGNKAEIIETGETFEYERISCDNERQLRRIAQYNSYEYTDGNTGFPDWFMSDTVNWDGHDKRLVAEFASDESGLFSLDLHEKGDGPHMLIGGMTGSGKSELIVSMFLSLAFRYPPDYVRFIIVDYKGGGIAQSLSIDSKYIPHICATADNLETDSLERLLISLSHELKTRQQKFRELSSKVNRPVLNIDDYLEYEKMAHLIVLVDEFGELKKRNPEMLEELISYSRIGRSLGLHLILSTQKPSSSLDEEIISNTSIRLALKTADRKDSMDIIDTDEAANIFQKGGFIVKTDKGKTEAQAFYSKRSIGNRHETALLDYDLSLIRSAEDKKKEISCLEKMLRAIINSNYEREVLDYSMPNEKTSEELRNEYGFCDKGLILGETDDYLNATKRILVHDLNENALIYSSRANEINGILNALSKEKVIVISNRKIKGFTDSLTFDDEETIEYLFEKLKKNSEKRYLVIEDISCFLSYSDGYISDILDLVQRSDAIGLVLILITRSLQLPYRLVAAFERKYIIKVKDRNAVNEFFMVRNRYKGESFFYSDEPVSFVAAKISGLNCSNETERYIETIPDTVCKEKALIGIDYKTRTKLYVPQGRKILIVSKNSNFLKNIELFYDEQFEIQEYIKNMNISGYDGIIYSGDPLAQNLFFVDSRFRQKEGCALYCDLKTVRNIVMVNHE